MNEKSKLVPFTRARRRPHPARVAEFAATARKLQSEREDAAAVPLAEVAALGTVGAVERLGQEVEARLDRAPREALEIAERATAVADALPAGAYPAIVLAQVRAHAWKDRGQALCYLARHEEALAALDHADAILTALPTLAHDLAIVRFVRATTLQEMGRFEPSMQLLTQCAAVFQGHGDGRRLLFCGIARANMLHRLKRFREARDAYVSLLEVAQELRDKGAEAHLHHDIGFISVELEDFAAVDRHLDRAIALCVELDWPVQAARSEIVRGVSFARRGDNRTAIAHIARMRGVFLAHGLIEEAGIFGLEIVQSYLALSECQRAELLARQIVNEFTGAGLNTRAITALGYLTEAIAAQKASRTTVSNVREYIVSLRKSPEREFVATA